MLLTKNLRPMLVKRIAKFNSIKNSILISLEKEALAHSLSMKPPKSDCQGSKTIPGFLFFFDPGNATCQISIAFQNFATDWSDFASVLLNKY